MTAHYFKIGPHDSVHSPFVLWAIAADGRRVIRPEYEDLVCPKCKKVNEKAALARGISRDVRVKSRRPVIPSLDDLHLVDDRARAVFSSLLPDTLDFYSVPGSNFSVASAKRWLEPGESNPGFRIVNGRQCGACGRWREVVWSRVPPQVDRLEPLLCFNLDSVMGARECWLVRGDVAEQLEKVSPPLTGLVIVPYDVEVRGGG